MAWMRFRKKDMPGGLWTKCPSCEEMIFGKDLEAGFKICPKCSYLFPLSVAERIHYKSFMVFTLVLVGFSYPITGHWIWGGGWLAAMGMRDFAGSTVVHSVGGWAALAGAIVVGPRIGKFGKDGKPRAIPGHNLSMAALGVLILFLGWFGFNGGSTTTADGSVARIIVNTFLAACAGTVTAMLVSWVKFGKSDVGMTLNGTLAGLVAITAPCATVTPLGSILIGITAGVIIVYAVLFFDKIKIDDPVGAISVHGICGVWGTFAVGLFKTEGGLLLGGGAGQVISQLIGIGAAFAWTFPTCLILFYAIKMTVGLRVSEEEEIQGLDLSEHGMEGYPLPRDGATSPAGSPLMGGAGAAVAKPRPAHAES